MAKKRRSKKKRKPKKRWRTRTWAVGRLELPVPIEGMVEPPTLRIVLERTSGWIVGHELDAAEPGSLTELVLEAMDAPMKGPARRPDRIVTDDPIEAERLRGELELAGHGDIDVVAAEVPDLERVGAEMFRFAEEAPKQPPPDLSYLAEGVTREEVATLFEEASRIHGRQPWLTLGEDDLFRIFCPTLGLEDACAMVIGQMGQSFALLLFPSLEGQRRFLEVCEAEMESGLANRGIGSPLLSLNFERAADLPRKMRKEAAKHGWPVAAPEAYPWLQHLSATGELRPTRPKDVRVATAVARALTAYLDAEVEGPVRGPIEVSSGEHRITIEAYSAPGGGVHEQDRMVIAAILGAAEERFGDALHRLAEKAFPDGIEPGWADLQLHWLAHEAVIDGRRLADWFLEPGPPLSDEARAMIEAQEQAWFSVWEVADVDPGESLALVDHLTGEERRVHDVSASETVPLRATIFARVIDYEGQSLISGVHERFLGPTVADGVVAAMRKRLRRKTAVPPERLRAPKTSLALMRIWREGVAADDERRARPMQLQNTDGDPLLLTEDRFTYDQKKERALREGLDELAGVTPSPDGEGWALSRPGNAVHAHWDNTIIAHLELDEGILRVETNSLRRADEVRAMLEDALGALVRFQARSHDDPTSAPALAAMKGAKGPHHESSKHPPEVLELLRSVKAEHYATWVDEPVRALGGQSPREMAKTKKGRERVELLLREMEHREQLLPPEERFDVSTLREELGLPRR